MNASFELTEPSKYTFLTDNEHLNQCCENWLNCEFLALDTEFIRTSTFYPKMGLIQICDGSQNYLIDPFIIDDWQQFKVLMLSSSVLKILHSCSEDLLVFFAFLEIIPSPIFDTQIAAAFLNQGFALSYQNLVKERKGIEIPKGETRSDWLQRPLTDSQLKYAALDVAYLPEIYLWQSQELEKSGKLAWHKEECQRLIQLYEAETEVDFGAYYLGIKGAWQLNQYQLGALKTLAAWREEKARKRDKPRSWIIKDRELLAIARTLPQDNEQLAKIPDIHNSFVRYEGEQVLSLIQTVRAMAEKLLPELLPRPLTGSQKKKLKKAQIFAEEKSLSLSIPVEVFARKRCLMALFNNIIQAQSSSQEVILLEENINIPEELRGWRKEHLLQPLFEIFR